MILDSLFSPVSSSNPSFDDEKERLARIAGNSPPGKLPLKSVHVMVIYLSVWVSLSKSSVSSIMDGSPKVFTNAETPLLSPDGVNIEES